MLKKMGGWFKGHRMLRVLLPGALALVLVTVLVLPAAFATAPEYPDVDGTYTVKAISAKYLDGGSHPAVKPSTLVLDNTGRAVTGTLTGLGADITLAGLVGGNSKPYISLSGTNSLGATVSINGRVTLKSGKVTGISGKIEGFITSEGTYAQEGTGGDTAAYSAVSANSGVFSALLTAGSGAGSVAIRLDNPLSSLKVSSLKTLTAGNLSFMYKLSAIPGPQLELRFTGPNGIGHVDVTVMALQGATVFNSWQSLAVTSASTRCIYYGNDDVDATPGFSGDEELQLTTNVFTLAQIPGLINNEPAMTAHGFAGADNWKLTRVGVEFWEGGSRTCYVDDIKVGKYTYTLEPTLISGTFKAKKTT